MVFWKYPSSFWIEGSKIGCWDQSEDFFNYWGKKWYNLEPRIIKKKKDLFMAECKLRKFTISSMICDLENGGNVSTVLWDEKY